MLGGFWMTVPSINRLRLDYEVKINQLQNSLIVRALHFLHRPMLSAVLIVANRQVL